MTVAADMPTGTQIHLRPDLRPSDITSTLVDLLDDIHLRAELGTAARKAAMAWQFDDVAAEVVKLALSEAS